MSRVLGFVRDVLIAAFLGRSIVSDAFLAAFRFPNLFRRVFGEGAFNAAFVPLFSKELEKSGRDEALAFANRSFTYLGLLLLFGTLVVIPGMDWVMAVFTPGFRDDPVAMALTVAYTRITFSYLLCMALAAHLSGVLNTLRIFAMPAFAPVLLNIVFLLGLGAFVPLMGYSDDMETVGYVCAWCVFVAGFLQLGALWVACWRAGMPIRPVLPKWGPRIKRLCVLMGPGIVTAGVQQINIVVGTMIASSQTGDITTLYYADRVTQLPIGLIGVAFYTVLLTEIARTLHTKGEEEAMRIQSRAIIHSMLLTIPAAVAFCVIAEPLMCVIFVRHSFTPEDAQATGRALFWFATGLPAYVLVKLITPGYFAREKMRTPMRFAFVNVVLNVVASLILYPLVGFVGIAMATSIAGWVNVALLVFGGRGFLRMGGQGWKRIGAMFVASGVMAGALWGLMGVLSPTLEGGVLLRWAGLLGLVLAGLGVYGVAVFALRAITLAELRDGFRR